MSGNNDDNLDDIDLIPLKVLPHSGLTAFKYDSWEEGDSVRPNNVLISCLDELQEIALVGVKKDGTVYCASSSSEIEEVSKLLTYFQNLLMEYEMEGY